MKRIIGITGGVGSGKSRILEILKTEYNARIIQADQVARELMEPGREAYRRTVELLGTGILAEDGTIDRPEMARRIFQDPEKRRRIDELTHPLVWQAIREEIAGIFDGLIVIEAALPEQELRDISQEMWYVYTSRENRIARLAQGRGYSREKSLGIMDSQLSDQEFKRLCGRVIDNNGAVEEAARQIHEIITEWEAEEQTT